MTKSQLNKRLILTICYNYYIIIFFFFFQTLSRIPKKKSVLTQKSSFIKVIIAFFADKK